MKGLMLCALVLAIAAVALVYEIAIWHECMADHSFWYCVRVLGK